MDPRRPPSLAALVVAGLTLLAPACTDASPSSPDADTGSRPQASPVATATEPATEPATQPAPEDPPAAPDEPAPGDPPADDAATASSPPDLTGYATAVGHQGVFTLAYRVVDHDAIPRNVECELDVVVLRDGTRPVEGASLRITGYMPAHRHGLVQLPIVEEQGGGRYRVSGLLLHMRGDWELRFTIVAEGTMETATFELVL